jgi:CheY-like chemotaxis protein/HPt (histidine-containing phosphotransfer) domain-containing protein
LQVNDTHLTLRFAVRDTGIGIPLEKQQRIFDAFTQEDSSVNKRFGGTGLGLTISNTILKYMGSSLSLSSELKKGSIFHFDITIPYEMKSFDEDEDEDLNIERVLIVDDNENNRIILKHMLDYKNINATLAANGLEALQILMTGERFDVILMDYHMPVISGLETIEKIKQLFNNHREISPLIVLHTSSEEEDVINKFRQDEKSFCLLKPIKSQELYSTLRQAVKSKYNTKDIPKIKVNDIIQDNVFAKALNVLLVDDNPVNMVLNNKMMQILVPYAKLTEKIDGLQALEACIDEKFDLILMDVQMPIMDGIEATKKIRLLPNYATVPIIGVTAGNVLGEKEKCFAAGMNDFLPKPIRRASLSETLMRHIASSLQQEPAKIINRKLHLNLQLFDEQVGEEDDFKKMFLNLVVDELTLAETKINEDKMIFDADAINNVLHKLRGTAATAGLFKLAILAANWEYEISNAKDYDAMRIEIQEEIAIGIIVMKEMLP